MTLKHWIYSERLPIALMSLMLLTRLHHFGDAWHLPDASWAVFFFAGFCQNKRLWVYLVLLAGVIDYSAIQQGTDSFCITPAYAFLLPTYGIMWLAGRYCADLSLPLMARMVRCVVWLTVASSLAFGISNLSFYQFSGQFSELSLNDYLFATLGYFPSYLVATLIYGLLGFVASQAFKAWSVLASKSA